MRCGPTKPSQIVPGEFYVVAGTSYFHSAIPYQIIHVRSFPRDAPFMSRATMVCEAWVFADICGVKTDWHESSYPLDAVNCKEHGDHDRHLERIELDPNNSWHRAIYRRCQEHVK